MKKTLFLTLGILIVQFHLCAQQSPAGDPVGKAFFPPELVMQNQEAIDLTETQKNNINKELQTAQAEFMSLQWELAKESEKLKSFIEKEKPSEKDVLEQLEKILVVENKIKKKQMTLLVRIKALLTHEQQGKLQQLRAK